MDCIFKMSDSIETIVIDGIKVDFFDYAGENGRIFSADNGKERLAVPFYKDGNEYGLMLAVDDQTEVLIGVVWTASRYIISIEERRNI